MSSRARRSKPKSCRRLRLESLETRRLLASGYGQAFNVFTDDTLTVPGLIGSYVDQTLRAVDQLDWRASQGVAGTRIDPQIYFITRSWGSRADVGLTKGSDENWDDFSVQWDGVVQVTEPGTQLALFSDDGSRMWIDLDADGFESPAERLNNFWGGGFGRATGESSPPLPAGVYPIRIQYEEGGGDNLVSLVADPIFATGSFSTYTDSTKSMKGLVGSYVNTDLRLVDEQDWRVNQPISGTRVDPSLKIIQLSWGARAPLGLTGGTDANWDSFSVQWDGVIEVEQEGTRIATQSDDASRIWIDLNRDGVFEDTWPERINNNWGATQSISFGETSVDLDPGVYDIRIQYAENLGANWLWLQPISAPLVRFGYVIPDNRSPQTAAEAALQDYVPRLQSWFAEQMDRFGLGEKTFAYETEGDGVTPVLHAIHVGVEDAFLREDLWTRTRLAVEAGGLPLNRPGEVWVLFVESHLQNPDGSLTGTILQSQGSGSSDAPGVVVSSADTLFRLDGDLLFDETAYAGEIVPAIGAHPLVQDVTFSPLDGSTFSSIASSAQGAVGQSLLRAIGQLDNFLNDEDFHGNIMGTGHRGFRGAASPWDFPDDDMRLSYATALALNSNRYFNPDPAVPDTALPTVSITTSSTVNPTAGLLNFTFSASDDTGLAAAVLRRGTRVVAQAPLSGLQAEIVLSTPDYTAGVSDTYTVAVIDVDGNIREASRGITVRTGFNQAPQPFIQAFQSHSLVGYPVTLDASMSTDAEDGSGTLLVEWDLDADGTYDTGPTTDKTHTLVFTEPGTRIISARITDSSGAQAVASPIGLRIDLSWQNRFLPEDVDVNGVVEPADVMALVQYINLNYTSGSGLPAAPLVPPPFYDVNGDGLCTPSDVLRVINAIHLAPPAPGEGESAILPSFSVSHDRLPVGGVTATAVRSVEDAVRPPVDDAPAAADAALLLLQLEQIAELPDALSDPLESLLADLAEETIREG